MSSILTNRAALQSLRAVNSLNDQLAKSAERISTGRRIPGAQDGATAWSLATRIEGDASATSTVGDALAVTKGVLDAATVGLGAAKTDLTAIRNLLVAAKTSGTDRVALQKQIAALQADMTTTATEASINGLGVLAQKATPSYNPVKSFVAGVTSSASGAQVSTINLDIRGVALTNATSDKGILDKSRTVGGTTATVLSIDISSLTDSSADQTTLTNYVAMIDAAMTDVVGATATVGATQSRVVGTADFLSQLETIQSTAVSSLVDANLEEEAAIKDALVVRQQLAIEALSIANSSLSNILALFAD
jgi:flagellin